jgi:hypothetical protein
MNNPILTFLDDDTNKRYFVIWESWKKLPSTVPMNLLTLLQYLGIRNKEEIFGFHKNYSKMLSTGTNDSNASINDFPQYLKKQALDYIALKSDSLSKEEEFLNSKLEELFSCNKSFSEFYCDYLNLIKEVNKLTRRQTNYYSSWAYTLTHLDIHEDKVRERMLSVKDEFDIPDCYLSRVDPLLDIILWIENNLFEVYYDAMASLFFRLGSNNLIPINSIPHVLRGDETIKELFRSFGMENHLPSTNLGYDVYDANKPTYVQVKGVEYLRQCINLYTFFYEVEALKGISIFLKSEPDLKKLLGDYLSVTNFTIVNLKNQFNNFVLPMIYTNRFRYSKTDKLLILDHFGMQNFHIFSAFGQIIDDDDYYDFYLISETMGYFQYAHSLNWWVRIHYDEKTGEIEKSNVEVENPYKEGVWEAIEHEFQRNRL